MQEAKLLGSMGPKRKKTFILGFANNKRADQPAHTHRLSNAYVIHLLDSIISKLTTNKKSILWMVSEAEKTGLSLALLKTPKTVFVVSRSSLILDKQIDQGHVYQFVSHH